MNINQAFLDIAKKMHRIDDELAALADEARDVGAQDLKKKIMEARYILTPVWADVLDLEDSEENDNGQ